MLRGSVELRSVCETLMLLASRIGILAPAGEPPVLSVEGRVDHGRRRTEPGAGQRRRLRWTSSATFLALAMIVNVGPLAGRWFQLELSPM